MQDRTAELAHEAAKGNRSAFQSLVEGHYDMIHRVAYKFTGAMEDADDITQDVCIALADKIRSFRGESSFKTWLYRITVNSCLDHHRKNKSREGKAETYVEMDRFLQQSSREANRQVAWLYREIAKLGEPLKSTALLVLSEDCSHKDAGKILGCAETTVSWRMHEIRKALKAKIGSGA